MNQKNGLWEITLLRPRDIPLVMPIERATFSDPWPEKGYRRHLQAPTSYYLALWHCTEGQRDLIGYGGGMIYPPEAHLANIAIEKNWRGDGLGSLLLLSFLLGVSRRGATQVVYLDVRQANLTAQDVYSRWHFTPIGVRHRYYRDGEDAIVMARYHLVLADLQAELAGQWSYVLRQTSAAAE